MEQKRRQILIQLATSAAFASASSASMGSDTPEGRPKSGASVESFPATNIRVVVPYTAGGVVDVLGRLVAKHLQEKLGTNVIVENRTGAGGTIGAAAVAAAPADGHTLLIGATGPISVGKAIYPNLRYNPERDFTPIALLGRTPFVLVTNKDLPSRTLGELVAEARKKPGILTVGSAGNGTPQHIIAEMFMQAAGVKLLHVPYKGSPQAILDMLGGRISMMFDNPVNMLGHIQEKRLVALAQTGEGRLTVISDVPTLEEAGFAGLVATPWYGVLGPAGIPAPIAEQLNRLVNDALHQPDVAKKLAELGLSITAMSVPEFRRFLAAEGPKWSSAAQRSGAMAN